MRWKEIDNYPGYEVSETGIVRKVIKASYFYPKTHPLGGRGTNNYEAVMLYRDGKQYNEYIHRLVAKAFVDGYFEGAEVNHIDENKWNNNAKNLEWCTREYNNNYGHRIEKMQNSRKSAKK